MCFVVKMQFSFQRAVFQTESDKQIKDTKIIVCTSEKAKIAHFYLSSYWLDVIFQWISAMQRCLFHEKYPRKDKKNVSRLFNFKNVHRPGRGPFVYAKIPRGKLLVFQR